VSPIVRAVATLVLFVGFVALAYWGGMHSGRGEQAAVLAIAQARASMSASKAVPVASVTALVSTAPLAPPPLYGAVRIDSDGRRIYQCADPAEICEHLTNIGCSTGRLASCFGKMSKLGEDVCLKLYEAKYAPQVQALGVTCNP